MLITWTCIFYPNIKSIYKVNGLYLAKKSWSGQPKFKYRREGHKELFADFFYRKTDFYKELQHHCYIIGH
jgi:hypothetical protein